MRVSSDTKDALIFYVGLFGIIGQGLLYPFHVDPSPILLGVFTSMIGLGTLPSILEARSNGSSDARSKRNGHE